MGWDEGEYVESTELGYIVAGTFIMHDFVLIIASLPNMTVINKLGIQK